MNMLNGLLAFLKCVLDFMLFFWFSMLFFNRRWKGRRLASFTALVILAAMQNAVNLLQLPLLNTLAVFTFTLAINLLFFTGPVKPRVICSVAEVLLAVICEFISAAVYTINRDTSLVAIGSETIRHAGLSLISICLFSMAILGIRHALTRSAQKESRGMAIPENLSILTVPLVSILTVYHIFSFDAADPFASLQNLILFLGILCMNAAVIVGDSSSRKQFQLQRELDRLNRLDRLNHVVIEQQDQYIQQMKGFAHDYTKQMEGIKRLMRAGEACHPKDIQGYADEMLAHIEESFRFAFIPSPALRAILTQAQLCCGASHIKLDAEIQYGDFSFIAFPDLYTLFENPLENAIAACREITDPEVPKCIRFRILKEKDLVWIEIKNPKSNAIIVKNHSIQTTRQETSAHGLGLKNMRRAIERCHGYLNIHYDSNEFTVTMAIPVTAG